MRLKTLLNNRLKKEETKETTRINLFSKNNMSINKSTKHSKIKEKRQKLSNKMRLNRLNTKNKFTNNSKNNSNRKIINLFKKIKLKKMSNSIRK